MYIQRSALRWKGILSILCLTTTLSASAQRTYTLDECLRLGAENNLTLRNSRLDTEAATETAKEAFTRYFPTVEAGGMILRADRHLVQMDLDLSALGVSANLPPLGFLDRGKTAGIMAMQPVFAGGRIVNGNRLARLGQEATRLQASQAADKVRADVEHYFWEVVSLKEQLQTLDTLAAQLDELHRTVKASVDAGVTLPNALMKVELQQQNLARRSVASATENLRLNRDSYEAGTVPLTDLLDAQTQLRLARDRYTEACTAYCNARTAYRQAVGE